MTSVRVRVPAKINLVLRVGPRRSDGYHDLATVFHAVGLDDHVTASSVAPGRGTSLTVAASTVAASTVAASTVAGDAAPDVPTDSTNLAWRAAAALAEHAGVAPDVDLHVDKTIPVAGGMAGGSADAAAALVACDALWDLRTPAAELTQLAAGLGSDVPFALRGGTATGLGRGERLHTVFGHGRFHWVVVPSSAAGLSTPAVYAELDRQRPTAPEPSAGDLADVVAACAEGSATELAAALGNDLQAAALTLRPELADVLARGRAAGALAGIVSGSGPTCVFLAGSADAAWELADALGEGALVTSGPVAGAVQVS